MDLFLENLPKVELHAHLNGSLNIYSIKQLGLQLYGENSDDFLKLCEKFINFDGTDLNDCFQKFTFMHELTSTSRGLKLACEMVIRNFSLDNVIYLELRTTPKANENMTRKEYIEIIINVIKECSIKYNLIVKLLLSIDRAQPLENAEENINLALEFKEKYSDIVKGVDLSGNPYKGKFKDFLHVLNIVKESNLNLALHCAEIDNAEESQEMIDYGFQRCGHGTFLSQKQLQQCLYRRVTVECCLTSNVKSGTVKSYESHHFKNIFKNNIPVVLCTDDSGVFDTTLTEEFKLASKHYSLKKTDFYKLSLQAIESSFANEKEKYILTQCIQKYFAKYGI